MKRFVMILAMLLALLPIDTVRGADNHYASLKTVVAQNGMGKVYASKSSTEEVGKYNEDKFGPVTSDSTGTAGGTVSMHAWAKPCSGYKFIGWADSADTSSYASETAHWNVQLAASTQKDGTAAYTYYAHFKAYTPEEKRLVKLTLPEGVGCDVSCQTTFNSEVTVQGLLQGTYVCPNEELSFNAEVDDEYVFVNWYLERGGEKETLATTKTCSLFFDEDSSIGVAVRAKQKVYARGESTTRGTYKLNGTNVQPEVDAQTFGLEAVSVQLAEPNPSDGYTFYGWYYKESEEDAPIYFSTEKTVAKTFDKDVYVGATFVDASANVVMNGKVYESLEAAMGEAVAGDKVVVLSDSTIGQGEACVVPLGVSLSIPKGVTLTIDGTLWLSGTLSNNGTINGLGTLARNYSTVRQNPEIHVPFPYGTDGKETGSDVDGVDGTAGKYVVTTSEKVMYSTESLGICGCAIQWFITVVTAGGDELRSSLTVDEPVGVMCTVNRKTALNWITSVGDAYTTMVVTTANEKNNNNGIFGGMTPHMASYYTTNYQDGAELFVLVQDQSPKNGGSDAAVVYGAFDCAGHTLSFNETKFNSSRVLKFFNGIGKISPKSTSQHVMNIHVMFYNCKAGSLASNMSLNSNTYKSAVALFDSPEVKVSWYGSSAGSDVYYNIYGGGVYSPNYQTFTHVYWGTFASNKDPRNYLADSTHYEAVPQSDNTWKVQKKEVVNANAAKIDNTEYETLADALADATANNTVVLLRDNGLTSTLTVGKDTKATLDLHGWSITGDGAIENSGFLEIVDDSGCVTSSEVSVNIVNKGGELYLAKATFSGQLQVAGGFCNLLSGTYNGSIRVNSELAPKTCLRITGGKYSSKTYRQGEAELNLVDLAPYGHVRQEGSVFHIGMILQANATMGENQSFSLKAFADKAGEDLYAKTLISTRRSYYANRDEWVRAMELDSRRDLVGGYGIDCTMVFDRAVAANTVSGNAAGMTLPMDDFVRANEIKSVLLPGLRDTTITTEKAPWQYGQFMPNGAHSSIALSIKNEPDVVGTTCRLQMRYAPNVKWQSGPKDYSYDMSKSALGAECVFVFGAGNNIAMLQTESGAVPEKNFFKTLTDAVDSDATTGQTIKLCNDCSENVTVGKPCVIDTNGFTLSGELTRADGFEIAGPENGVYTITAKAPEGPAVTAGIDSSNSGSSANEIAFVPMNVKGADESTTYQLELKSGDGWTQIGEEFSKSVVIPLKKSDGSDYDPTGLYRIKMLKEGVEVATSKNTIGVMRCQPVGEVKKIGEGTSAVEWQTAVVPVPWMGNDGEDMTLAQLLRVCDLSADDSVRSYDATSGLYAMWELVKENGVLSWSPYTTAERATGTLQDAGAAGETQLPRGTGLWLTRQKKGGAFPPIYLCGEYDETKQTSMTLKEGWNLVANPNLTAFDLNNIAGGAKDSIVIPSAVGYQQKTFTKGTDDKWGYVKSKTETKVVGGKEITGVKNTRVTTESTVAPGQGFWFVVGGETDVEIKWNGVKQ